LVDVALGVEFSRHGLAYREFRADIKKKKDPAWPWLISNSFSMVGSSGERMILAMKLIRKITARKTTGPNCGQKGALSWVR